MEYTTKKRLRRLGNKNFAEDIKRYIKSTNEFYRLNVPELKLLSKRLHEEQNLKKFYKIFNRLWRSSQREQFLALYTLQLYKEEFDLETWRFLKRKLREIKSLDEADIFGEIVGEISIKYNLIKEIISMCDEKNLWMKRSGMMALLPLIKKQEFKLAFNIIHENLNDRSEANQKGVGVLLREIGMQKPEILKRFLEKNPNLPGTIFFEATLNDKPDRKFTKEKSLGILKRLIRR